MFITAGDPPTETRLPYCPLVGLISHVSSCNRLSECTGMKVFSSHTGWAGPQGLDCFLFVLCWSSLCLLLELRGVHRSRTAAVSSSEPQAQNWNVYYCEKRKVFHFLLCFVSFNKWMCGLVSAAVLKLVMVFRFTEWAEKMHKHEAKDQKLKLESTSSQCDTNWMLKQVVWIRNENCF